MTNKQYKIAVLPGDGIGVEIIPQGIKALDAVAAKLGLAFEYAEGLIGGAAIDAVGTPLPKETLEISLASDAVFFGAVGGPKWDHLQPVSQRPEPGGLFPLRKALKAYANLRPVVVFESLTPSSSLKQDRVDGGLDILFVRELTGGIYFGQPKERRVVDGETVAIDTCSYSVTEITRIAHIAFQQARRRRSTVHSVDKANVMETSRLWREVVTEIGKEYPDVKLVHMLADNCGMQLLRNPKQFDVILADNLFGDLLTDEAAMLAGSLGMLPSASIGDGHGGLFEPIHGSAPDIAGQDIANPIATILTAAMLLRYACDCPEGAVIIRSAVESVLNDGYRTGDIATSASRVVSCDKMGDLVAEAIAGWTAS
ncbi:MAG: 3-isopropylmalate dehydrogenase [Armatimonadetes bacterium]|nr:3-isopropylmalate dehydrogenase [Armatimonadota bacterium]